MYFQEAEHVTQLRESIRRFLDREVPLEAAAEWDRSDSMPRDVIDKLFALGVCGLTFDEDYGGHGRDICATMAVIEELSKRSIGLVGAYIMAACYGGMNITESGSEAQKSKYLPQIAAGEILFAYGLSEPDVGGDLASVRTKGVLAGDKVIINGAKRWCTGATYTDYIITLLRSDDEAPKYKNLSLVLVPADAEGVSITPINAISQRGLGTTDVHFDNVEAPIENILGGEAMWNRGWSLLVGEALSVEKLEVAAMALGNAEAAFADAFQYSQERVQFGKPICGHQAIRHRLSWCRTKLYSARVALYHTAAFAQNTPKCGLETSMTKLHVTELCQEVVLACQRVLGAYGCAAEYPMERYVRESLVMPIAGGSTDMQLNNIANLMGLPR